MHVLVDQVLFVVLGKSQLSKPLLPCLLTRGKKYLPHHVVGEDKTRSCAHSAQHVPGTHSKCPKMIGHFWAALASGLFAVGQVTWLLGHWKWCYCLVYLPGLVGRSKAKTFGRKEMRCAA